MDYRYLNLFTVSDAFPIFEVKEVIQKVGSTFNCRHGYWQTNVRESNRWLTAFVCLG